MNQWQLNGQLLGEGVSDPRVFLSLSTTATATSSTDLIARRFMVAEVTGAALTTFRLDGVFRMSGTAVVRATSTIESGKYYAKYLFSAVTAQASGVASVDAYRMLSAVITGAASYVATLWRGIVASSSVTARAIGQSNIFETGSAAPTERTMRIPADDRKMKVV